MLYQQNINQYIIYSSGHNLKHEPSVYLDFEADLRKFKKSKPQMLSLLQEWALNAAPTAPSYIDTDSVRCERGCLSEFGCGGALYPVGGLGSHVSTCTILLTTLPGLTGTGKKGRNRVSPDVLHHRATWESRTEQQHLLVREPLQPGQIQAEQCCKWQKKLGVLCQNSFPGS